MRKLNSEESDRKKMIFDSMSPRRQKFILKKGYDQWDPFIEPQDPIDIRKDKTKRTSQTLIREFLSDWPHEKYSNEFGKGVFDICMGIINNDERYIGMYEFSLWYNKSLKEHGSEK